MLISAAACAHKVETYVTKTVDAAEATVAGFCVHTCSGAHKKILGLTKRSYKT